MKTRRIATLGLFGAVLLGGFSATSAFATPPPSLDSGYVTDTVDVLDSSEEDALNARLSELSAAEGIDLYVVLVDDFTEPADRVEWADTTAIQNGLGSNQYLLAIATEGRNYYISADDAGPLSDSTLDSVEQSMTPELSNEQWGAAITTAADRLTSPEVNIGGVVAGVASAAVVIGGVVFFVKRRGKKKAAEAHPPVADPNDPYAAVSDDELLRQAGTALVAADDAIRSSREELGFAVAQFGDDSTAQFTTAITAAQAKVSEAFALKQQLDDEVPDTAEQRRAWHIQIIQLCDEADDLLDDNVEAFEQLRQLEVNAPEALEKLTAKRALLQQTLTTAPAALQALTGSYDSAALSTVATNPQQANERLAFADSHLAEATTALTEGKRGEAAFAIRTAEEGVAQAEQLIAAITGLGANLATIEGKAKALIAELEADVAAAQQLPDAQGQVAAVVAATQSHLAAAKENLSGNSRSPQRVWETLDAANTEIDGVLAQARSASEAAQRAQQLLAQQLSQAQTQVAAANDYIATRRGAVGATARTRLAEASSALAQAQSLQQSDPAQALAFATRANELARQATAAAEGDVVNFDAPAGNYGGGYGGSITGSSGGDSFLGALLGGLLGGGGGGSSSGSWGSGGSGRSYRPSSYGGSSRSSRSSSRSSFRSSGGSRGRSGGGRF